MRESPKFELEEMTHFEIGSFQVLRPVETGAPEHVPDFFSVLLSICFLHGSYLSLGTAPPTSRARWQSLRLRVTDTRGATIRRWSGEHCGRDPKRHQRLRVDEKCPDGLRFMYLTAGFVA